MSAIVPITDRRFVRLKAKHKRKVAMSRTLDRRPNAPLWWLRLCLLIKDMRCSTSGSTVTGPVEATDAQPQDHDGGQQRAEADAPAAPSA